MQVCVVSVSVFVLCIEGGQVGRQAGPETDSWIGALWQPFSQRTVLQKEDPGVLLGEHPHHHRLPVGTEQ